MKITKNADKNRKATDEGVHNSILEFPNFWLIVVSICDLKRYEIFSI